MYPRRSGCRIRIIFRRGTRGHFTRLGGQRARDALTLKRKHEGINMTYDSHQRAAEFHEMAAHAHRAAAAQHGKGEHLSGHEHSRQAMEHAAKAWQYSQEANEQSAMFVKKDKEKKD
jgi:hypothetical protein